MSPENRPDGKSTRLNASNRQVAVIELGTTSIRMAVAQVDSIEGIQALESLQQAVSLARDTFIHGEIANETIEECVKALRSFKHVLHEYDVPASEVTAIATSAVREASNRDAFLDRLYIATGISVRSVDAAEVNRYTYAAVHSLFAGNDFLKDADTLVVEVGGGSTEMLQFTYGHVANSLSYRLGSLRLRNDLEATHASSARMRQIMNDQINRTARQMAQAVNSERATRMLALGGDIRLAGRRLAKDWDESDLVKVNVTALSGLAEEVLKKSVDSTVREFHISYPDADTLGPALEVYVTLARALGLRSLYAGKVSLRDGVLAELSAPGTLADDFRQQVINSALETGAKYEFDRNHAEQVAGISRNLFQVLRDEHHLHQRYELILVTAALLHDIGGFVSNRAHHKHSMYLILNSDIFGLGGEDLTLTALVARYHRRAMPKSSHDLYPSLPREKRVAVMKMAAILRVADAIARGTGQADKMDMRIQSGTLAIALEGAGSLAVQQYALRQKGDLFERTYGMDVVLRSKRRGRIG